LKHVINSEQTKDANQFVITLFDDELNTISYIKTSQEKQIKPIG